MSWQEKVVLDHVDQNTVSTWDLHTLETITTAGDLTRVKNLFLRGMYWVTHATESNEHFGVLYAAMLLFPDTVTTPDPDDIGNGLATDRQLKGGRFVIAAGQNNPTVFSFQYRAINVKPGFKLYLATQAVAEANTGITHRYEFAGNYWRNDD